MQQTNHVTHANLFCTHNLCCRLLLRADRGSGVIRLQRVTVKAPGQRFMQQLEVLLHKIYPKIREGVKRRIMPMLVRVDPDK